MMKKGIVMPAHLVDDGLHGERNKGANLFLVGQGLQMCIPLHARSWTCTP
jgi:hypothetical protein